MAKQAVKSVVAIKPKRPAATAGDDAEPIALKLKAMELSPEMAAYFAKCEEKLGFVPNVLRAYAFDRPSCRPSSRCTMI
jgi:hypothetical protein